MFYAGYEGSCKSSSEGCVGQHWWACRAPTESLDWAEVGGVKGAPLEVHGLATMEKALAGKYFQVDFVVVALLRTQTILGLDFMEGNQCVVNETLHSQALECQYKP